MPSPSELLFGKLAVMNKMVSPQQVDECIQLQEMFQKTSVEMTLGEILVKKKYMTQPQVEQIVKAQHYLEVRKEDLRFGEIAVANGFTSQGQVHEVLQLQEAVFKKGQDPPRIGQILIEKQYLTQQQVIACLKAQARMAETQAQQQAAAAAAAAAAPPAPAPPTGPVPRATRVTRAPTQIVPSPVVGPPPGRAATRMMPAVGGPRPPQRPPADEHPSQMGVPAVAPVPPEIAQGVNVDGCCATAHAAILAMTGGRDKTILIVEVEGDLDGHTFPYFEEFMNKVVEAGYQNVVIDCKKLNYIASPGIGVLVGAARRCRDAQGDIRLCSLPAKIIPVIEMLGFKNIIRTFEHDKGAINSFKYM